MSDPKKPTLEELEAILNSGKEPDVEILPSGELRAKQPTEPDKSLETRAQEFRESLLETGVGIPGQSAEDNRNFDFYLTALLRSVRDDWVREVKPNVVKDAFKVRDERALRIVEEVRGGNFPALDLLRHPVTTVCDEIKRRLKAPNAWVE